MSFLKLPIQDPYQFRYVGKKHFHLFPKFNELRLFIGL